MSGNEKDKNQSDIYMKYIVNRKECQFSFNKLYLFNLLYFEAL